MFAVGKIRLDIDLRQRISDSKKAPRRAPLLVMQPPAQPLWIGKVCVGAALAAVAGAEPPGVLSLLPHW